MTPNWRSFPRGGRRWPQLPFPPGLPAGPYPFLLMSVSPQDLREVRSLQQVPKPAHYQRSHVSVHRRVIPTGTAARDSSVPRGGALHSAVGGGASGGSSGGSAYPPTRTSQGPTCPSRVL